MGRVNQARQDAEWVLANVLDPSTPLERMAVKGAKAALRQLDQLAKYRAKNIDRIRAYSRQKAAEKLGRPLPELREDGTLARKRGRPRKSGVPNGP